MRLVKSVFLLTVAVLPLVARGDVLQPGEKLTPEQQAARQKRIEEQAKRPQEKPVQPSPAPEPGIIDPDLKAVLAERLGNHTAEALTSVGIIGIVALVLLNIRRKRATS